VVDSKSRTSRIALPFGLTGGIACGKSTVAGHFQELGARVIDADRIGHEVIEPGHDAYQQILKHFGDKLLDSDGRIDRKQLGPIVFADPQQLQSLNTIVHPRIIARSDELARAYYEADPRAVVILDAALIFESGIGRRLRKVIVVWCRPEQQLERLISKTGLSREAAELRIRAQMPVEQKLRRADYIIDCSGSKEGTRLQVEQLFLQLQALADRG
jgi:dephospho-CoA kinase